MEDRTRDAMNAKGAGATLSRREVLVGVGALGVGAVGAGILGSCQSPRAPAAPAASAAPAAASASAPQAGAKAAASMDMKLVGTSDLQARSSYQPVVQKYPNGKYILFVGHHTLDVDPVTKAPLPSRNALTGKDEENGTSILDVTDPASPKYLAHIPVADGKGGGAQMVRVVDGNGLPAKDGKMYMLRSYHSAAHEIWDVTDPASPKGVRTVAGGNPLVGAQTGAPGAMATTHKSWWEPDTGIAYVVGSRGDDKDKGWRTGHHIMVYDLSDPAQPKFIRDWALDGQQPGGKIPPFFKDVPNIHGPISTGPKGNRVYMAYGTGENGVLQIVDRAKLLGSAPTDYTSAEVGRLVLNPENGVHTSFPLGKITVSDRAIDTGNAKAQTRDVVAITSEATAHFGDEPRHIVRFVDVTDEGRPEVMSTFQVAASSGGSGDQNFIDRGGRFGPHATNEEFGPPFYQKVVFVSYFNAGVRAIDVRDPYNPKEVAYFIPETTQATDKRVGKFKGQENVARQVIQTNNVTTDDRGNIFIVDRANTGLHILQLTGKASEIVAK
jgi:hypothetical protein